MSYVTNGDWRIFKARLVADATVLTELLRTEMPPLHDAADVLDAMGLLVDEWARAVVAMGMAYSTQLGPTTVEQLRRLFQQLCTMRVTLRALSDAVDPDREHRVW